MVLWGWLEQAKHRRVLQRLDSRAHDNAFVVQFAHPYCSCVSRGFLTMSARGSHRGGIRLDQLGEDRLLRDILHGISTKAVARGAAGDDCAVMKLQGCSKLLVLKTDCV